MIAHFANRKLPPTAVQPYLPPPPRFPPPPLSPPSPGNHDETLPSFVRSDSSAAVGELKTSSPEWPARESSDPDQGEDLLSSKHHCRRMSLEHMQQIETLNLRLANQESQHIAKVKDLEAQIKRLSDMDVDERVALERLKHEDARQRLETLGNAMGSLTRELSESKEELEYCKAERNEKRDEVAVLNYTVQNLRREIERLNAENTALSERLEVSNAVFLATHHDFEVIRSEARERDGRVESLLKENSDLREECAAKQREIDLRAGALAEVEAIVGKFMVRQ